MIMEVYLVPIYYDCEVFFCWVGARQLRYLAINRHSESITRVDPRIYRELGATNGSRRTKEHLTAVSHSQVVCAECASGIPQNDQINRSVSI